MELGNDLYSIHPFSDVMEVKNDELDRALENNQCVPHRILLEPTIIDHVGFQTIMGFMYSLIWLIAVISNSVVLYVLLKESRRDRPWVSNRRSSNVSTISTSEFFSVRFIFVASLALADLLTSLLSLPATSISTFTRVWIFPDFMCHMISVSQGFSIFLSSFTFTSIAIDRYLLIFYPNQRIITKKRAKLGLAIAAALSFLFSFPLAFFQKIIVDPEWMPGYPPMCGRICMEIWPKDSSFWRMEIYGSIVLILQFGLPTVVTAFCYSRVANRLRQMRNRRLTLNGDLRRQSSGLLLHLQNNGTCSGGTVTGKRQRTNRMMLAMVVAFILSWSPLNAFNLARDYGLTEDLNEFAGIFTIAHLISMTACIWNPIMYAWFNQSIRDALKLALCWSCRDRS